MKKFLSLAFFFAVFSAVVMTSSLYAQDSDPSTSTTEEKTNPEDDLKPNDQTKLNDTNSAATATSFKLNEQFNAAGSFWHPTQYSQLALTAGLGIFSTDVLSGVSFDITGMFEYSLEEVTYMPLSVFAQTGLGLTSISYDTTPGVTTSSLSGPGSSDGTNFGLRALWLGAKYRMFNGEQISNVFLSFLGMFGFGFGSDAGDAMFAGHKHINPGDFSLLLGATACYLLNSNMGFNASFFLDFYFWSYEFSGFSDNGTEFGATVTLEYFYQMTNLGIHAGLDMWFASTTLKGQRYWLFAKAMMLSGIYAQLSLPLEGGTLVFALLVGYQLTFGSMAK